MTIGSARHGTKNREARIGLPDYPYCLLMSVSIYADATVKPSEQSKELATITSKAKAIAEVTEALIATAAPCLRYVELRYLHCLS